jgi:hypothetical protein
MTLSIAYRYKIRRSPRAARLDVLYLMDAATRELNASPIQDVRRVLLDHQDPVRFNVAIRFEVLPATRTLTHVSASSAPK